jgi:hypothetical protein
MRLPARDIEPDRVENCSVEVIVPVAGRPKIGVPAWVSSH